MIKTVTITQIAEAAGVSFKTVSRALNEEANVSQKMRDRVKTVAEELGYRPNVSARALRSNKSLVIVHFEDNPNTDYLNDVYKGLHAICHSAGYFAVKEPLAKPYRENAKRYFEKFRVGGVILSPPLCDDAGLLLVLIENDIPFVRLSPLTQRGVSSECCIDDEHAAEIATNILIKLGHRKIGFIMGPADHRAAHLRKAGFDQAVMKAGGDLSDCKILEGDFSFKSAFEVCEEFFSNSNHITAIFASNDDMALGAIMAAMKSGLDVPQDISIIGFDGSRLGEIFWPNLTTIDQPIEAMSAAAAKVLLSEIAQPDVKKTSRVFDVKVLERGTTLKLP